MSNATTRHPEYEHALPGYGAFKFSDAKDAKRRRPDSSLEPYAQARGLEFLDTANPNGYQGVVPGDSRLQFNVLRGTLPGGRGGILFHHVLAVPYGSDGSHTGLTTIVYKPKLGFRAALDFIPVLGHLFEATVPPKDKRPSALGVPTTEGAALVPEVATVPPFKCGRAEGRLGELLGSGQIRLGDFDVPGLGLVPLGGLAPERDFVERLMATPFAGVLRAYADRPHFALTVAYGRMSIRLDGYLDDEEALDALGRSVSDATEGLARAGVPLHAPRPFTDSLPDPNWPKEPREVLNREGPIPPTRWLPWLDAYAREHDCTPEDTIAYHRAFPHLPVPGTAFAVLRLTQPGTAVPVRLAWHNEMNILTHNAGCNAVLLPAVEGAPAVERTRVAELELQYAVRDGVFCVWALRRWQRQEEGMGDIDGLREQALDLAKETGLTQL